jgi:SAM-dependent methyltransferase
MAMRNATDDWRYFDAGKIPTKASTPHLDRLLAQIGAAADHGGPIALLDVGCGDGRLSKRLYDQGLCVTGVDISPAAVAAAGRLAGAQGGATLRFAEADFAADQFPRIEGGPFDVVVCQLVLSIIGDDRNRNNLLRHIRALLRPDGWLYLSASGVSDAINPGYARLYAEDALLTGEPHSYFSRNEQGEVLYMTHHFTGNELEDLLKAAGFGQIEVSLEREASSRRPEEAAFFLYATCRPA